MLTEDLRSFTPDLAEAHIFVKPVEQSPSVSCILQHGHIGRCIKIGANSPFDDVKSQFNFQTLQLKCNKLSSL